MNVSFVKHRGQYDIDLFQSCEKFFGLIYFERREIVINLAYGLHRAIDALLHELGHAFLCYALSVPGKSKLQVVYDLITYFFDPFMSLTDKRHNLKWLWGELNNTSMYSWWRTKN